MKTNTKVRTTNFTHEGAPSTARLDAAHQLRRSMMSCMLFEDNFYEDGVSHADRVAQLIKQCSFEDVAQIAIDAREKMKLRHAPLLLVRELIRNYNGRQVGDLIYDVIQRPDEITELLALYWKDQPGAPLSAQMKIGLGRAFGKFTEYQLAKWDKPGAIRLRDVLFLSHAHPAGTQNEVWAWNKTQRARLTGNVVHDNKLCKSIRPEGFTEAEILYGKIANDMLETPDTWEVQLSGGADKKAVFERLIQERKLGALALLRNLRLMTECGVEDDIIRDGLNSMKAERVLPFRFINAAKYAARFEPELEGAMFRCLTEAPKLGGKTALLIDHSGSMGGPVSRQSDISRFDAAAALAMVLRETTDKCRVFTFAEHCVEVAPRRGFALVSAVKEVVNPVSTKLGKAVNYVYQQFPECNRIIVITDEQSQDRPGHPHGHGYIINVAGYQNGIGYGPWVTIDGWSEAVLDYIRLNEEMC